MKTSLTSTPELRIAKLEKPRSQVTYGKLTVDVHSKNSLSSAAILLVYQEALLAGAGKLSREAFLDAVNKLGGSITVSVTSHIITITLKSQATQGKKLIDLTKLVLTDPTFSTSELNRIKKTLSNELQEQQEDARHLAHVHLERQLFNVADRRYSFTPTELRRAVSKVTKKDLQQLHRDLVTHPWIATIGTEKTEIDYFVKTLQSIKAKLKLKLNRATTSPLTKPKTTICANLLPSKTNIEFSIGAPLPITLHHPDFIPFSFGLAVLGKWGGFTGRLMSTVRELEGLTYGIYARTQAVSGTETGYWRIMTFFNPKDADRGLQSTFREITSIAEAGITKSEYERFKVILNTQQRLLADSYTRSIDDLHNYVTQGFSLPEIKTFKAALLKVTKKEVDDALKKYLQPSTIVVSGVGPTKKWRRPQLK